MSEEKPKARDEELWNHMVNEYDLHLFGSEMHEIELIVARMLANDRPSAPGLSSHPALAPASWLDALIQSWERKIERWESGGSSVKRPDTVRHIRMILAELRAGAESASKRRHERPALARKD